MAYKTFEVVAVASALTSLGEHERALQLLEEIRPRGALLWMYLGEQEFDSLRDYPRFQQLVTESKPRPAGE